MNAAKVSVQKSLTLKKKIGILLINTGTPLQPSASAIYQYLKEFLSDPHVIRLPRMIWLPILYGLILPLRSRRSAKLYEKIWTSLGSPMRIYMQAIAKLLEKKLSETFPEKYFSVKIAMNYGEPLIKNALMDFSRHEIYDTIVLPLFPQYSHTSTGAAYDRMQTILAEMASKHCFNLQFIEHYSQQKEYIDALAQSVKNHWQMRGRGDILLISFHGIPKRYAAQGDPYPIHCVQTSELLARSLGLTDEQWMLCYQSKFGYDQWLEPATFSLLKQLPERNITKIDLICPGFSVDCLETLEEIAIRGKEIFLKNGGKQFNYIPALNDSVPHIEALAKIIMIHQCLT